MFKIETERIQEEIVLKQEMQYLSKLSLVEGVLYLTSSRLYFKSNDDQEITVSLNLMLANVSKVRHFGFFRKFKNCVLVVVNNKRQLFVVANRQEWAAAIDKQVEELNTRARE